MEKKNYDKIFATFQNYEHEYLFTHAKSFSIQKLLLTLSSEAEDDAHFNII